MRWLTVVVLALAVAPVAWGANGEPKKALTKQGNATARSIVLKRADLSAAFTARARPDNDLPKGVRCGPLDESDLTITGQAESPDFQLSQPGVLVTVGSTVNVYRSLGESAKSWRRGTSAHVTTCLADIVRLSAPKAQRVTIESAKRVSFPKVSPQTAAFRVVATLTIGGTRVRAYVDAIILQHGRIQSGVVFTSLARPVGQEAELTLVGLVASRMARANRPKGPTA